MKPTQKLIPPILGSLLLSTIFFYFLPDYLPHNPTDFLGLTLLPFIAHQGIKKKQWFYFIMAILFWLLNRTGTNTLYYASFICTLLFYWEYCGFRFNWLPLFLLTIIAPITRRLAFTWSFPIRLQLSEWAGNALSFVGFPTEVSGNVVIMNGAEFSVDPACAGLKMISLALVFGLFILGRKEKELNRRLNFVSVSFFLFMILIITIFANFNRLLALILFHVLPENPLHEIIGLISLFTYVLLPAFLLARYYVSYFGRPISIEKTENLTAFNLNKNLLKYIFPLAFLSTLIVIGGIENIKPERNHDPILETIELPEYEKTILENGIVKMEKANLLLYLKPPITNFGMPHDPRYCWQGSGWTFQHIREVEIEGIVLYAAKLEREGNILHTLWWYDNGEQKSIYEKDWRWNALIKGKAFRLVNITSDNEEILLKEVIFLLNLRF